MKHTTQRSSSGKKLYAVRNSKARFKDIQAVSRVSIAEYRGIELAELEVLGQVTLDSGVSSWRRESILQAD